MGQEWLLETRNLKNQYWEWLGQELEVEVLHCLEEGEAGYQCFDWKEHDWTLSRRTLCVQATNSK